VRAGDLLRYAAGHAAVQAEDASLQPGMSRGSGGAAGHRRPGTSSGGLAPLRRGPRRYRACSLSAADSAAAVWLAAIREQGLRLTQSGLVVYPPQPRPGQVKVTLIGREDAGVQIFTGAARPASIEKPR